jgi:hypothetical protein
MPDPLLDELPIMRELGTQLSVAFHADESGDSISTAEQPRHRQRMSLTFVAAVAAVSVACSLFFSGGGRQRRPVPNLAVGMANVADVARSQPDVFPSDRQFFYLSAVVSYLEPIRARPATFASVAQLKAPKVHISLRYETWSSAAREGLTRSHVIHTSFGSASARRLWNSERHARLTPVAELAGIRPPEPHRYLLGDILLTRAQLLSTPPNPRLLYRRLLAAGGTPPSVFSQIADTLAARPVPSRLRAALYETISRVPGAVLSEPAGRDASTVTLSLANGFREALVFNRNTAQLLKERTVATGPQAKKLNVPSGTVTMSTIFQQRGVVGSAGQLPR